ncbi:MAG: protease modulator HflC [Clostridia bacterium]|nr:protease modulator HflC [Clostridia bacterium]
MKKEKKIKKSVADADGVQDRRREKKGFPFLKVFVALALVAVFFYFGFTTEVREGNCAVILRFGAVREEITESGLYLKLPWPFETVVTYDNRLQYLESNNLETTTKDKRNVIIQSYIVWEINDPILYHNSVGSQGKVDTYIKDQVFSAINSVMGAYELKELLSLEKETVKTEEIQQKIFERVRNNCDINYGINVNDVSILRLQLSDNNLQSVFAQMRADRQKDIDIILSNAQKEADKITADADTEASKIIADGVSAAAAIKAQTEAEVAKIYSEAQAANLEFYQFLKQLDTVVASVGESTVLVVKADEYPFNVLTKYGDYLTNEGDETIIKDLGYILTQLPETDRKALIDAVYALIDSASKGGAIS